MSLSGDSPASLSRHLALLTPELAGRTQSAHELAFLLDDAELAVRQFVAAGQRVTAWDCWVRFNSGARARSLAHSGSFALPLDVGRAGEAVIKGMRREQEKWDRSPEHPEATLYFTIELAD